MNIRQMMEEREREFLQKYAAFSAEAVRDRKEPLCEIRTEYQRDRDRILHSKAFRRMKDKTQVFLAATGDHYRNRLTHTLEVSQAARTIAKALSLNEELTEAIGLGHDLGHTPFGHTGEAALDAALKQIDPGLSFKHYLQSVRVVEYLEKNGKGLNLTAAVRDGIKNHGTAGRPITLEGQIVRLCDKIAYINHDIDDAIRAGVLSESDLPAIYTDTLGHTVRERLNTLISDTIYNSQGKPQIFQSGEVAEAMSGLRQFMFDHVYHHPVVKQEEEKAQNMLTSLFFWYMEHPEELPQITLETCSQIASETCSKAAPEALLEEDPDEVSRAQVVCDYIAGMTDHYAIARFEELFVPKGWRSR
ncbi:MAG: deoxyguanosinetriphosphate triphosphohydrolase [Lachnospiraceae bacterium]|nr:deoxyguanosinetriphosphate triphosphohydrolase [Lachnospiraceae bacterium]